VTALMFIFAGILGGIGALGGSPGSAVQPGQIGQFPLMIGDIDTTVIGKFIGIGFLLMTPSAADMVKKFIGAGQGAAGMAAPAAAALGAAGGFLGNRAAQSRFGRAASDIMEHRGREGAQRLVNRVGGQTPDTTSGKMVPNILARGRLPK